MEGVDVVFHQAALRITRCAEEPAAGRRRPGRRHVQRARGGGAARACARSSPRRRPRSTAWPSASPPPRTTTPTTTTRIYGAAKAVQRGHAAQLPRMHGLDYVALRYFNVYGPRMDVYGVYTEVLVRWMERIAAGQPPLILGDGSQTMDFVYIADIARANLLAAESDAHRRGLQRRPRGTETSLAELAAGAARGRWAPTSRPSTAPRGRVNGGGPPARPTRSRAGVAARLHGRGRPGRRACASLVEWWRAERAARPARSCTTWT